jgi:protein-S-isoprenylcysteine O-methyltransferase Ste14
MKSHGVGFLFAIAGILSVLALPMNPLVILNIIEPNDIGSLRTIGWIFWAIGIILVILPYYYIYYRKEENLMDRGIYAIVRHPLYLGWILGIFVATAFLYQHWLFVAIGIPGTASVYFIARYEERSNLDKFGDDYKRYMQKVPRMNFLAGVIRLLRRKRGE